MWGERASADGNRKEIERGEKMWERRKETENLIDVQYVSR